MVWLNETFTSVECHRSDILGWICVLAFWENERWTKGATSVLRDQNGRTIDCDILFGEELQPRWFPLLNSRCRCRMKSCKAIFLNTISAFHYRWEFIFLLFKLHFSLSQQVLTLRHCCHLLFTVSGFFCLHSLAHTVLKPFTAWLHDYLLQFSPWKFLLPCFQRLVCNTIIGAVAAK